MHLSGNAALLPELRGYGSCVGWVAVLGNPTFTLCPNSVNVGLTGVNPTYTA